MENGKKLLGLVLAGGGSLGSYEVGAIEALEELGYKFDIVTGTSIGALNGAFVCSHQTNRLRDLWEQIAPEKVMKDGINISVREARKATSKTLLRDFNKWLKVYVQGGKPGADISPFKEYIKNAVDVDACLKSEMKFGVVTSYFPSLSLVDVNMHEVKKEEFLSFLHASSACFPIFPVEVIGKNKYVDGFYNDNLPIRLAFSYGADEIIALDMRLFSLKPQHDFYLKLPNVTYIAPYVSFGSLMDFSQEVIQKNMKLGYYDVMKHYKKMRGFFFNFNGKFPADGFLSYILRKFNTDSKYLIDILMDGIRTKMDETDFFVRAMEILAMKLGIKDYFEVFDFETFKEKIEKKVRKFELAKKNGKLTFSEGLKAIATKLDLKKSSRVLNAFLADFSKEYLRIDVDQYQLGEDDSVVMA